jgi:hypothetical protein
MKSATTLAPALRLGTMILFLQKRSNPFDEANAPFRYDLTVFAMTPCRGLSLYR